MDSKEVLEYQEKLAEQYRYKPVPPMFADEARAIYRDNLPDGFCLNGDNVPLYTAEGLKLCEKYNRIVIGDYGAFVEIAPDDIVHSNIKVKKGQEYRDFDERYSKRVKYSWLTAQDNSDVKIYFQKKTVGYADYVPGMYYISPYECFFSKVIDKECCGAMNKDKIANWLKAEGVYTDETLQYYCEMAENYGSTLENVIDNGFFPSDFDYWVRLSELCGTELNLEQYKCIFNNLEVINCSFKELNGLYRDLAPDVKGAIYLGLSELVVPDSIAALSPREVRFLLSLSVDKALDVSKFCKIVAGCKGEVLEKDADRDVRKILADAAARSEEQKGRDSVVFEHVK